MAERPDPAIGLEVHVRLATATKLFCGDRSDHAAGPNVNVCPVCLGLPGALPVLNERAVELALAAALALGCDVAHASRFERKSYFYPDLPKGYQITQRGAPLATGGSLDSGGEGASRVVRIRRVHLEEDTARTLSRSHGQLALDHNRAGSPLIEIVTDPDVRSPAEARRFLVELRRLLRYLGVSECRMEAGELRVDANVSLRIGGRPGGYTELKNLNSFSGLERALGREIERQRRRVAGGDPVRPRTLAWDDARRRVRVLRRKEVPAEYRYLPDPDLPPLRLDAARVRAARDSLPEPPARRAARLVDEHGLSAEHAAILTSSRDLADYFEAVVASGATPHGATGWVLGDVLAAVNSGEVDARRLRPEPAALADLIAMVAEERITRPAARRVFREMLRTGARPGAIVGALRLHAVRDDAELEHWVGQALAAHPREAARLAAGERKLIGYFVGVVVQSSHGRADPWRAAEMVRQAVDRR